MPQEAITTQDELEAAKVGAGVFEKDAKVKMDTPPDTFEPVADKDKYYKNAAEEAEATDSAGSGGVDKVGLIALELSKIVAANLTPGPLNNSVASDAQVKAGIEMFFGKLDEKHKPRAAVTIDAGGDGAGGDAKAAVNGTGASENSDSADAAGGDGAGGDGAGGDAAADAAAKTAADTAAKTAADTAADTTGAGQGGRRRSKRKGRKGSRKSRKGRKGGNKQKQQQSSQSQNGGRRSRRNRRKYSRRSKH
jgi:hypothetical protein